MRSRACKSAEAKPRRKLSRLAAFPPAAALCSAPCLLSRTSLHLLCFLSLPRPLARSLASLACLAVSPRSLRWSDPSAHLFRANTPTAACPVPAGACLLRGPQRAEAAPGAGAAGDERGFAARDRTGRRPTRPLHRRSLSSATNVGRGQHCALDCSFLLSAVECCWLHCSSGAQRAVRAASERAQAAAGVPPRCTLHARCCRLCCQ